MIQSFDSEKLAGEKLASTLEHMSAMVSGDRGSVRPYADRDSVLSVNSDVHTKTYQQIQSYLDLLNSLGETSPEFYEDHCVNAGMLRSFLDSEGLRCSDERIYRLITDGPEELVEVYDKNFHQIFRNPTFLTFSSYDLYTLFTVPFYQLYDRPKKHTDLIISRAKEMMDPTKGVEPYFIEPHFLKEIYQNKSKFFKIRLKYICPVVDRENNAVAIVSTNICSEHKVQPV